jgi:predicted aspartyl protease
LTLPPPCLSPFSARSDIIVCQDRFAVSGQVDTGATLLSLPARLIRELGLSPRRTRRVISRTGATEATLYEAVRLTIQERDCTADVMEVPDDVPVLIGQLPLENLDLVVDLRARRLTGNPAHGGEQVFELY